jgi:hypothetical protein
MENNNFIDFCNFYTKQRHISNNNCRITSTNLVLQIYSFSKISKYYKNILIRSFDNGYICSSYLSLFDLYVLKAMQSVTKFY